MHHTPLVRRVNRAHKLTNKVILHQQADQLLVIHTLASAVSYSLITLIQRRQGLVRLRGGLRGGFSLSHWFRRWCRVCVGGGCGMGGLQRGWGVGGVVPHHIDTAYD